MSGLEDRAEFHETGILDRHDYCANDRDFLSALECELNPYYLILDAQTFDNGDQGLPVESNCAS